MRQLNKTMRKIKQSKPTRDSRDKLNKVADIIDWTLFEEILRKKSLETGVLPINYKITLRIYIYELIKLKITPELGFLFTPIDKAVYLEKIYHPLVEKNTTKEFAEYVEENNLTNAIEIELNTQLGFFREILEISDRKNYSLLINSPNPKIINLPHEVMPVLTQNLKSLNPENQLQPTLALIRESTPINTNLLNKIKLKSAWYFGGKILKILNYHKKFRQGVSNKLVDKIIFFESNWVKKRLSYFRNQIKYFLIHLFSILLPYLEKEDFLFLSKNNTLSKFSYIIAHFYLSLGKPSIAYDLFYAVEKGEKQKEQDVLFLLGNAAQLAGFYKEAERSYKASIFFEKTSDQVLINLGHVLLALDKEEEALRFIRRGIRLNPRHSMSHQNLAAQYDSAGYKPQLLDLLLCSNNILYDAYNLLGERFVHLGEGNIGKYFYARALSQQKSQDVCLPFEILHKLNEEYLIDPSLPIRILSYEWLTLIGHIAMLDSYIKLQHLGITNKEQQILILAPKEKISNQTYFYLWRPYLTIIEDPLLIDVLFPYQRYLGDCFNGYIKPDGMPGDWTELAASGQVMWDRLNRESLIKIPSTLNDNGNNILKKMGLKSSDWFACLHVRSSGFHNENSHSVQSHRDSKLSDYLGAIKAITEKGGWVVRLGDESMDKLPQMNNVIDYPHSKFKSAWMDIFLISNARFFIGTTSGLSNAVISFGTPCLLVNCISNYFQLWNKNVLFTLKLLWNSNKTRYMTLPEMIEESFRWKIFNINKLNQLGIFPHSNSADEITAATKEIIDKLFLKETFKGFKKTIADDALQIAYDTSGNKNYFGNGRLSESFFQQKQGDLLLS